MCVGPQYLQGMWSFICPELLKAIDTEPENEVLAEHMHSLAMVTVDSQKYRRDC